MHLKLHFKLLRVFIIIINQRLEVAIEMSAVRLQVLVFNHFAFLLFL